MDWFKTGKGVFQVICRHSSYLTYMHNTLCEMQG